MDQLRSVLFVSWMIFGVALLILALYGTRGDPSNRKALLPVLAHLFSLWLPAIACFSAFWFKDGQSGAGKRATPGQGQVLGTYCLTTFYFAVCILVLFVKMESPQPDVDAVKEIGDSVSTLLLLSTVFLAPVAWLTGHTPEVP